MCKVGVVLSIPGDGTGRFRVCIDGHRHGNHGEPV